MTGSEVVLGGIVIAIISGAAGKMIGSNNRVKTDQCNERRQACNALVLQELSALKGMLRDHIEEHRGGIK